MNKSIIFFVAIAGTFSGYAQLGISPEAGINFSMANSKIGDLKTDSKYRIGYKAGVGIDITIYKGFYIQPGIYYTIKGAILHTSVSGIASEDKMSLNYFDIPINLAYRYDFNNAGSVFAFAGPYWGIGINRKSENNMNGVSIENDIKYGDAATDEFIKADFGLNFGIGYISPVGIYLRLQYAIGLSNISNTINATWKNQVFSASLGYVFELNQR